MTPPRDRGAAFEAFERGYKDGWADAGYSTTYRPEEAFDEWQAEAEDQHRKVEPNDELQAELDAVEAEKARLMEPWYPLMHRSTALRLQIDHLKGKHDDSEHPNFTHGCALCEAEKPNPNDYADRPESEYREAWARRRQEAQ